jgi:histidine ammonia-lyase
MHQFLNFSLFTFHSSLSQIALFLPPQQSTMPEFKISPNGLSIADIRQIIQSDSTISLSEESIQKIQACRSYLDKKIATIDRPVYGVTTGFGALHNKVISNDDLEQLQVNLVRSHACGMGDHVPGEIVHLMLLLKAVGLSFGHSGSALSTVEQIVAFYNNKILPEVFQQGSLGASGDLAPLAHVALALLGEGKVDEGNGLADAQTVLSKHGLSPLTLQSKEGLALLNGTQFMSAYGVWLLMKAQDLLDWAELIGAMSLDAYDGRPEPFKAEVHRVRKQPGQEEVASRFRAILEGSSLIERSKKHVQDPYSFRCMPQVHGASRDAVRYIQQTFENEINSVTDNPTIFPEEDEIISAGNFHGQPLALALDHLCLAMSEIGSISERRIYKLIAGERELPSFLVQAPGLNSGFMIPQYTAASIASQNKSFCYPASADTIDSSQGQEDHVSMGANSATKAYKVIQNVESILAIELLNAAQALDFRRPEKSSPVIESLHSEYRSVVPFVAEDRVMHDIMDASLKFMSNHSPAEFLS